jgi:hypothetical protein
VRKVIATISQALDTWTFSQALRNRFRTQRLIGRVRFGVSV